MFAADAGASDVRHRSDFVVLASALFGLAVVAWVAVPESGVENTIGDLGRMVPSFARVVSGMAALALALWVVALVVVALFERRTRAVLSIAGAVIVAEVIALLGERVVDWPANAGPLRPWASVASMTAMLTIALTVGPRLVAPARRWGRSVMAVALFAGAVGGIARPTQLALAFFASLAGATIVHLVVGAPRNLPEADIVLEALATVGLHVAEMGPLVWVARTGRCQAPLTLDDGRAAIVHVYGRDAHDAQLLNRLWRAAWYREQGLGVLVGRRTQAEHTALVHLLARDDGIDVPKVLAVGVTSRRDAVLVTETPGSTWADRDEPIDAVIAAQAWDALATLHASGIGRVDADANQLTTDGRDVGFTDLSLARIQPTPSQRAMDRVQLLVEVALELGPAESLRLVIAHLDGLDDEQRNDEVAELLRYLQPAACTAEQRKALHDRKEVLDELRSQLSEATGVEQAELEKLQRFTLGSLVSLGLPVIAFAMLWRAFSTIDLQELRETLAAASIPLILLTLVLAQTPRFAQALSTRGALPRPVPYGPLYALQLAINYLGFAVPSTAARMAMNIRFMQRQGLSSGTAITAGALDSFVGFLAQVLLFGGVLLTVGFPKVPLDSPPAVPFGKILGGFIAIGLVLLVLAVALPKRRAQVVAWVKQALGDARETIVGLRGSPSRLLQLFGGNLASELLFAVALSCSLRAMGYSLPLTTVIVVNIGTSLLAGLLPVPGGIGVAESALTFGFVAAGVPQEAAFGAALVYRLATYYLPPIWGFFAFRWLQRQQYL